MMTYTATYIYQHFTLFGHVESSPPGVPMPMMAPGGGAGHREASSFLGLEYG